MNKEIPKYLIATYPRGVLCYLLISFLFFVQVYAQTITVKGKVSSSRYAIQNASVTFINMADTAKRYSAITNTSGNYEVSIITTSVPQGNNSNPEKFELAQNYPNPFSSTTAIPYRINQQSYIQLAIFDLLGREVRKYDIGHRNAGTDNVLWDGRNTLGQKVAQGVYFYVLKTESESKTGKMLFSSGGKMVVSLSPTFPVQMAKHGTAVTTGLESGNYEIRIENTENTSPLILSQHTDNVAITNDTTINFSVSYIATTAVDFDSVHQYIRGFGGINIPNWQGYDMTDSEIESAFGTGEGQLGFTILRLQIQPDSNQWSVNVPTAKKAYERGATIFASPWDPPSDMLDPNSTQHKLLYDMYGAYAMHLNSFNTYMSSNGVPLYAISVQNEPDYGNDWTRWTSGEMVTFMRENAPAIQNRIIAPESFQFIRSFSDAILNDSLACAHLDIVGGHVYGGGAGAYPLAAQKGKEIWMTEHYTESANSGNLWPLALDVATDIHSVMSSGMNAYVWWYIVRFYGPILDGRDASGPRGQVTKRGYIMSQYSRFIRPGYQRVQSNVSPFNLNLYVTAYKDSASSKAVIVAVNKTSNQLDVVIRLKNGSMSTFAPYTTSETKNVEQGLEVTAVNNQLSVMLDAMSVTTFVSK